jgi:hypothetical protein
VIDPDLAGTLLPVPRAIPPSDLAGLYIEPPMSVLDRRSRRWQQRTAQWRALGVRSELGRDETGVHPQADYLRIRSDASDAGLSIFDPVLTELCLRWFSHEGDRVLDPFAGGSVRGVVSSALGRWYTGVDLRPEQVEANRQQAALGGDVAPEWIVGDSCDIERLVGPGYEADAILTCPPYGDLERYSDDPADLSTMTYPDFLHAYRTILDASLALLRRDRYLCVIVGDVRDPHGGYRGLPDDTRRVLRDAGCTVIADIVILDPLGSKQMVAARTFEAGRLVQRVHQYLIVAVKGDRMRAAARLRRVTDVQPEPAGEPELTLFDGV